MNLKKINIILSIFSLILLIVFLFIYKDKTEFKIPKFDINVKEGVPIVDDDLGYKEFEIAEGYTFSVCGNVILNESNLYLYLTSPKTNAVYIKVRVLDGDKTIAESGLIKPGEYLEKIKLSTNVEEITLKIMGYEKDTYYSAGTVTLNPKLSY